MVFCLQLASEGMPGRQITGTIQEATTAREMKIAKTTDLGIQSTL